MNKLVGIYVQICFNATTRGKFKTIETFSSSLIELNWCCEVPKGIDAGCNVAPWYDFGRDAVSGVHSAGGPENN